MSRRRSRRLPGKTVRFFAALSGMVLTILLLVTVVSALITCFLTCGFLHDRIATDEKVVKEQVQSIRDEVTALADEYGFAPETVMNQISDEAIRNIDREASHWLTEGLRDGKLKEAPVFRTEMMEEALQEDASFIAGQDPYMLKNTIGQIKREIEKTVTEKAMLFRETLVFAAEKILSSKIHLPSFMSLIRQVPILLLLACALLSGLIAILTSSRLKLVFRYIGSALTACGILLAICIGLGAMMDIGGAVTQISAVVSRKFQLIILYITGGTGLVAVIMIILGILFHRIGRRATL